jgi:hypothetical protein
MDIHKKIRVHKRQEIECHKAGKFSLSNIIRSISNLIFIPIRVAKTPFNKRLVVLRQIKSLLMGWPGFICYGRYLYFRDLMFGCFTQPLMLF